MYEYNGSAKEFRKDTCLVFIDTGKSYGNTAYAEKNCERAAEGKYLQRAALENKERF
jgi:hypothetical protein